MGASPQARHLDWYRYALLLTGSPSLARDVLWEALSSASARNCHFRDRNSQNAWLARRIRDRSLPAPTSKTPPPEEADADADAAVADERWQKAAALPEPGRSVFALFQTLEGSPEKLADFLGLRLPAFAQALVHARQALAPGLAFPASAPLCLHRPWGGETPAVLKAVRAAEAKNSPELATQTVFDGEWRQALETAALPDGAALPALAEPAPPGLLSTLCHPAGLAMGVALLVVMGVVIVTFLRKMDDFPGKETVSELVEETDGMNGSELEQIEPTELEKLGDWFLLKGFEGFAVPPELEHAQAIGCRVYKHDEQPVAQVALNRQNALFLTFKSSGMNFALNTPNWSIYQQDEWAVAVRGDGENCFIVTFLGDSDDMKMLLHTLGK